MVWKLNPDWPSVFFRSFAAILLDAFPFLLLGALASAALETFVSDKLVQAAAPKSRIGGLLFGSLLGLALPLCECGMIPVARRLIRKGLPAYIGIVYIIAGPVVNPIVFASTVAAFSGDPAMAVARLLLALATALAAGTALLLFMRRSPLRETDAARGSGHVGHEHGHEHTHEHGHEHGYGHEQGHGHGGHGHGHGHGGHEQGHGHGGHGHGHGHEHGHDGVRPRRGRLASAATSIASHAMFDMRDMGKYLLIGAALTALVQTVLRPQTLEAASGHSLLSHLFLMGFAFLLSLCSTSDAFVAASLAGLFHPGAILAFLVFGPMLDLKGLIVMLSVFRKGFVIRFALLLFALVLAGSIAAERLGWLQ
ncbi:permease [Cohnella sp. JJ-181]|uniref:permease n=1 Tax=Cohnella rhizoplanae TaxID=2974897 RepID=UPI00232EFFFE|nr:permease [Cohnella sp. JJ-181]